MPSYTYTVNEQIDVTAYTNAFQMILTSGKTETNIKALEVAYATFVRLLKNKNPNLHKSIIFVKRYLRPNVTSENLDLFNTLVAKYALDTNDVVSQRALVKLIETFDFCFDQTERSGALIDRKNYYGSDPTSIVKIMATTNEIGSSTEGIAFVNPN